MDKEIKLGINIPFLNNSKEAEELARKLFNERLLPAYKKNSNICPFLWWDYKGNGCGNTRNEVNEILFSQGFDYVLYVDADDYLDEDYIDKVYEACSEGWDVIETQFSIRGNIVPFKDKLPNHVCGICYRVDLIKDIKFNEKRNIGEDTEYNTFINENKEFTRKCLETVYHYNFGMNNQSLSYKFNRNEISEFKGGDDMK